jgi:glycerophosphoryl diester phosphodiesterase
MKRHTVLKRIGLIVLIVIGVLLIAYILARLLAKPAPAHPWFAPRPGENKPLVFAHQGAENLWPSNTLFAFQHAAALGADVLDMDMHMTRDGVLVLMHDQTIDRTTDGTGAIRDLTLDELKQLDAGYRFTTDEGKTYPYRGQGLTVPTLEELFKAFPDKRFGIEIKQTDPAPTAQRFCALIRQYNMQDRVLVSSFRQENMDAFRAACPEVATSATENEVRLFYVLFRLGLSDLRTPGYNSFQVPEASGGIHLLTPQFITAAHRRGLAVQPWTINETEDLKRILALGVDGINTDNPDRLFALLK